jgi:hypothetical protein
MNAAGKSVNVSLFIHHPLIGKFSHLLFPSLDPENLALVQHLAEWSVMDVVMRNQTLFFSGILFSSDSLGLTGSTLYSRNRGIRFFCVISPQEQGHL